MHGVASTSVGQEKACACGRWFAIVNATAHGGSRSAGSECACESMPVHLRACAFVPVLLHVPVPVHLRVCADVFIASLSAWQSVLRIDDWFWGLSSLAYRLLLRSDGISAAGSSVEWRCSSSASLKPILLFSFRSLGLYLARKSRENLPLVCLTGPGSIYDW